MPKLLIICFSLLSITALSQINITFPTSRAVFQRNNNNQCIVYLAGNFTAKSTKIEARAVARPMAQSQGSSTAWSTIQTNPQNGFYSGALILQGGWYDLYVRAWNNNTLLGTDSVQRVGVGEVFVIAGQSNASGSETVRLEGNYGTSAVDDRVSFINFLNNWDHEYQKVSLPAPVFQHADSTARIAPFGISGWCWGALGDQLVQRLKVPVAFFNAAWSGSSIGVWSQTADDSTLSPPFLFPFPKGMPYGYLRVALNYYVAQFGVRAVLWHQGETDNAFSTTRATYATQLKNVIEKSRIHTNKPNLAWVVSRASYYKGLGLTTHRIWQPILDAQNDVIGLNGTSQTGYTTKVFAGPETDSYKGSAYRDADDVHFKGQGHVALANLWNTALSSSFFQATTPSPPLSLPLVTNSCIATDRLSIQLNLSYPQVQWTSNVTATDTAGVSSSISNNTGSYIARVKDYYGNILLSPKIIIPSTFSGLIPIQSLRTGPWNTASTWSCGRIPSILDEVTIQQGHVVSIPLNGVGNFKDLLLNGQLIFSTVSALRNN